MEDEMLDTASDSHSQAPILEIGDQPSPEFLELFAKLDPTIGGELIEKAWKQFDTTSQQIVLEGNQNVWMACAFFTSVWQQTPIAQQQQHELVCHYSLTRLLELCQVSVLDFFDKLNKWMEMILANRRFQDFVNRVQSNLAVSAVIFKKFLPIYRHVFVNVPQPSPTRAHKSRYANMPQKLTSRAIFDLTWLFYIALRKQLPQNQEDLLSSYHLLICVIDYIYNAMEAAGLQKHLNPLFATSLALNEQTPLERLCEEFDAVTLDAKHLRVHWMLPRLRMLSIEGAIGELEGGIFSAYDNSRQAFEELYELRMMARSEVDERIFLRQTMADVEGIFSGTLDENAVTVLREFDHSGQRIETDLLMKISTQNCLERLGAQKQPAQQPIVGKSYLITPETVCPNITLNADLGPAARMEQMLTEYREENENILEYIFEECQGNPRDYIAQQLLLFTRKLVAKVDEEMAEFGPDYDAEFEAGMGKHIPNMETLFYYFLQRVVTYDRERALNTGMEMNIDLGAIFQSNEFLASLFICSADLILWANGSQRKFPWAANLFEEIVQPLNFYRIIELIIWADTGLTKQMVKHLNWVEECVLEELAWAQDSKIWKSLQGSHAVDKFGEISPVPGSQILARTYVSTHRHADLAPNVIMFFKKVYHLAAIRLTDLCERIRVMDDLTRQKIWTLFEHIFRMQTTMLKGRHLDQLILCSIYIIVKVSNLNITFQEIMQHYRHQPQAASRVFREVLMESPFDPSSSSSTQTTSSSVTAEKEDLIKFYNRIFISRVEDFVKLLHPSGPDTKENLVPLSPMPKVPLNPLSPRKLINERINVVPMSQYAQSVSQSRFGQLPGAGRRYDFHKSPSKDLKNINAMVRGIATNSAGPSTSTNVEFGGQSSQYYQPSSNGSIYQ